MKASLRILLCGVFLLGCNPAETGVSHRDILDDYKALNIRVGRVSHPLLVANHDICDQTIDDNGIRWHQLEDYPEDLQPVAQSYWDVSETRSIFYVLPGSEADKAGLKSGDRPSDSVLDEIGTETVCRYAVLVSYVDEINAYATGNEIIVTSGMLRSVENDKYLALILSHEMSHNVLGHVDNPDVIDIEDQADQAAIKLMARAGLDFEEAIESREQYQQSSANGGQLPVTEKDRIAKFKSYSQSTKSKQSKGEAVWP
ncbi:MAG: M48 family metalloprotease [Hyphomonadaceae bacterium]|nr:M48 family metalloprotease [Hyphomonadaceae bacterium]